MKEKYVTDLLAAIESDARAYAHEVVESVLSEVDRFLREKGDDPVSHDALARAVSDVQSLRAGLKTIAEQTIAKEHAHNLNVCLLDLAKTRLADMLESGEHCQCGCEPATETVPRKTVAPSPGPVSPLFQKILFLVKNVGGILVPVLDDSPEGASGHTALSPAQSDAMGSHAIRLNKAKHAFLENPSTETATAYNDAARAAAPFSWMPQHRLDRINAETWPYRDPRNSVETPEDAADEPTKGPMKTIREYLEELPDGYRERALAAAKKSPGIDRLDHTAPDIRCAIHNGISWPETDEGFQFWTQVVIAAARPDGVFLAFPGAEDVKEDLDVTTPTDTREG